MVFGQKAEERNCYVWDFFGGFVSQGTEKIPTLTLQMLRDELAAAGADVTATFADSLKDARCLAAIPSGSVVDSVSC